MAADRPKAGRRAGQGKGASKDGPTVAFLVFLTFLWFFLGIADGIFLPWSFKNYQEAGPEGGPLMLAGLVFLLAFPIVCVSTVLAGWRNLIAKRHARAVWISLIPFPFMALAAVLLAFGWP